MMKTRKTPKHTIAHKVLIVAAVLLLAVSAIPAKAVANQQSGNDTTRKKVVIIEGDGPRTTDSMDYVINGKKSSHNEFDKIRYDDIISVNWVSAENAAKIFDNGDNARNVLFVTTYNSAEGKKMLAKVNTVNNHKGKIFDGKALGLYKVADGDITEIKPGDASVYTVSGYNKTAGGNPQIITAGGSYNTISAGNNRPEVYTISSSNNGRAYVSGSGRTYKHLAGERGNVIALADGESESGSELSDLSDKLIIINDKEATAADLKKLPAFDIDKMSFKDDDYTRHQYGDKAKNGVVYIYTKKAKK